MKIEKLNDTQIRCTLTSDDLANRKIKLSELAYGTEKARNLFHDMMVEANQQFGFNSENSPLMVEAIPVAPDSIVLIITKVDDPQELDTRFAKFAPSEEEAPGSDAIQYSGADDIIDLIKHLCESKAHVEELAKKAGQPGKPKEDAPVDLIRLFRFSTLDDVISSAHALNHYFCGQNSLYHESEEDDYQLVLHQSGYSPEDFNKICNILSEYGIQEAFSPASEAYLSEHGCTVISNQALQELAGLSS